MIQLSNLNRVMEPETISKNGELSRREFFECVAGFVGGAAILGPILAMYGCSKPDDGPVEPNDVKAAEAAVRKSLETIAKKGYTDAQTVFEDIVAGNKNIAGNNYGLWVSGSMMENSSGVFDTIETATVSAKKVTGPVVQKEKDLRRIDNRCWRFTNRFDSQLPTK